VFLETNSAEHVSSEADVMDPLLRHRILQRLGAKASVLSVCSY